MSLLGNLVSALPKADLHCHLDGSLRLATMLDLARQQGVQLPANDVQSLAQALHQGQRCESLEEYLSAFEVTLSVLQTPEALRRAAYELAEDCASENVRYLEVRYSPILHQKRGLTLNQIMDSVLAGLEAAKEKFRIRFGVIVCGMRHLSPQTSLHLARLCFGYKDRGVVGFDLAGAEKGFPAKEHQQAFSWAHQNHILCTVHAGEGVGPDSIEQAIRLLGANRIGHGTRLRENPELLEEVKMRQIPLEVCLTSNAQTGVVSDVSSHPFGSYFRQGLKVTLNTDNRLIGNTTMTQELLIAHRELGLTVEDLLLVVLNGFDSAFLATDEKIAQREAVKAEMGAVLARFFY